MGEQHYYMKRRTYLTTLALSAVPVTLGRATAQESEKPTLSINSSFDTIKARPLSIDGSESHLFVGHRTEPLDDNFFYI